MAEKRKNAIRLLLIDDHPVVLEGMRRCLGENGEFEISGAFKSAKDALPRMKQDRVDVVVTDLRHLDDGSGLDGIKEMCARIENLRVLVFSAHDETIYAERALRLGASGYLMKTESCDELRKAIGTVAQGGIHVSEAMSGLLIKKLVKGSVEQKKGHSQKLGILSEREFEIFEMIGEGHTSKEIAASLGISLKTVETHRAHIKAKLSLGQGVGLIQFASRWVAAEGN